MTDRGGPGAALTLRRLGKAFGGSRAVSDLSLSVEPGTFLTLLGPSGSGKTTTLRMIAGLEEPTEGEILLDGQDITAVAAHKRNIGVVFQHYALFPHLTVFKNVAYPLEMRRLPRAEIRRRVEWALHLVQLGGFETRYPKQMSGGQQQRVALARAIVFEPPVLLLDEPLGALDKRLRELMQIEIRALQRQLSITTVSVTHDQVEALVMSDQIAVLHQGTLQQLGPPLEVYRQPASRFVADFLGEANVLSGSAVVSADGRLVFRTARGLTINVAGETPSAGGGATHVVVRPEYVRIGRAAPDADNRYAVSVREVFYVGDLLKHRVVLESGEELIAKSLVSGPGAELREGEKVFVGWDAGECLTVNG